QAAGFETSRSFEDGVVVVEFPIDPTAKVRDVMESREHRAEAQSVAELLRPKSIAVIGASRYWGSIGFALLENIIEGGYPNPDRKSTRLNSSHVSISYAVFCLKKKLTI